MILTLLEHIQAKTDRSNRIKHRTHALEYCTLAAAIDPKNANVLNQLANHYFHSWKVLVASDVASEMVFVLNENHLALHRRCATSSSPGDHFRINGLSVNFVLLEVLEERLLIRFSDQLQALGGVPTDYTVYRFKNSFSKYQLIQSTVTALETKELAMAERYAAEAIKCTMLSVIKAESYFIIGKINHIRRNPEAALEYYRLSLQENSDMILAAYGAAQILLSKQEFDHSLDFFEKVLQKNPLDKDTQAYVMLLKAIRKKEDANFDKLREIVPGFQFEIDLWLIQGQIKQRNNSEHLNALKCYLYAKEGMERRKTPVPPTILSNMAVLYHSLGKMEKALEYSKLAIIKSGKSQSANLKCSLSLSNAEFEGVFFVWSPIEEKATISREDGNHFRIQDLSAKQPVSIGDTIIIGNVAMVIEDIDGDNFRVASPLNLLSVECQGEIDSPKNMFDVQIRTPLNNFTDSTLTYCYNFARLLEDAGHSKPAFDLYVELLKHHPSFIECRANLKNC